MKSYIVVALLAMSCLGLNVAMAQNAVFVEEEFTVAAPALVITGTAADLTGLSLTAGQTLIVEASQFLAGTPPTAAQAIASGPFWTVDGPIQGTPILLSFILPPAFIGQSNQTALPITYSPLSGLADNQSADGTTGVYFDPRSPYVVTMGPNSGSGGVYVGLGFEVHIPATADADTYDAVFGLTAAVTGF
ncbi:MAG: hypothetical protein ABSF91_16075 [Bacteroidota bacterium]|jgi:hypothetical protein